MFMAGVPYPLYILDNASQDHSYERLIHWKNILKRNVNIFRNRENIGFAKANNQLVRLTQSKIIVLLNPILNLGRTSSNHAPIKQI